MLFGLFCCLSCYGKSIVTFFIFHWRTIPFVSIYKRPSIFPVFIAVLSVLLSCFLFGFMAHDNFLEVLSDVNMQLLTYFSDNQFVERTQKP